MKRTNWRAFRPWVNGENVNGRHREVKVLSEVVQSEISAFSRC